MTLFTLMVLLVAAAVVLGALYFALRNIGLQEAEDPTESHPEELTNYEREHVHRADVR